ncbi:SPOR domain-containing protein, partial [Catenovulum agarivorans]|uniref:SPOR domain-containing protein n=1 Tax=Catenovulum agarivorans TaxID=1172192 RepID=UPI0003736C95
DSKYYVIQLTLISSDKLLADYLAHHTLIGVAKVYHYQQYFAVTVGLYPNLVETNNAIKNLPASLQNKGAFAKSVADIKKRINDDKKP